MRSLLLLAPLKEEQNDMLPKVKESSLDLVDHGTRRADLNRRRPPPLRRPTA